MDRSGPAHRRPAARPSVMIETGKFLLIDPAGREQRHYSSFAPRLTHGDEPILKVQHWLQARAGRATSVSDMATHAGWRSALSCVASRLRRA